MAAARQCDAADGRVATMLWWSVQMRSSCSFVDQITTTSSHIAGYSATTRDCRSSVWS